MPHPLQPLLEANRRWAAQVEAERPGYFHALAQQQNPKYLWIGCSDSRVPANQITGLEPGEVFVHRNIANVVAHGDLNVLSVIQFAAEHILVVGHYGCGGVQAVLSGKRVGLADHWLRHVHDVRLRHRQRIDHLPPELRQDALCEINVIEQVGHVATTHVLQDAWARGQRVAIHGWCYGLKDGLIQDLGVSTSAPDEVVDTYRRALKRYPRAATPAPRQARAAAPQELLF